MGQTRWSETGKPVGRQWWTQMHCYGGGGKSQLHAGRIKSTLHW